MSFEYIFPFAKRQDSLLRFVFAENGRPKGHLAPPKKFTF